MPSTTPRALSRPTAASSAAGPAGAVLALLLARQGVAVTLPWGMQLTSVLEPTASVLLATRYGAGFWATLPAGILLAVAVAAIFGLVALRSTGVYFLMITLALGMVVWGLAHRWVTMTQGDNGISAIPRPDLGLPLSLTHSIPFYYFALAGFFISFRILRVIVRSPFGQTLVGIRESESRMRTLGYHVWLHKYIGFIIAGGFAGFAGVLWAYYNGFVSPVDLQLATSVEVLLMVALGGRGTLLGPALGGCRHHCPSQEPCLRLHASLAFDSRYRLYRHDRLCSRRHRRSREAMGAAGELPARYALKSEDKLEKQKEDRMKKQFIVSLLVVVTVIMVGPSLGWGQKGPIKVGFLTQMTGGGAAVGKDMSNGFTMYIEEISNQIAGRKVEVIIEDTQGDPAQALTKLRKLAESDNVHAVAGIFLANEGYARSRQRWMSTRVPTVWAVVSADDLTQRKPSKMGRPDRMDMLSQPNHPFGDYVVENAWL